MLKKLLTIAVIACSVFAVTVGPAMAAHHPNWNKSLGKDSRVIDHQKTAMSLSWLLPGVGEWYLRDYEGGFPWGECILGYICCFIKIASVIDASDGVDNAELRFNFWASPKSSYAG